MRSNSPVRFIFLIQLLIGIVLITPVTYAAKNQKPIANAGIDQTVGLSSTVKLDGTGSADPDGVISKFQWTQTSGTKVKLIDAKTATPSFESVTKLKKK